MKRTRDGIPIWKTRPARKQANHEDVIDDTPQSGFYNIFYDKVEDFGKWQDRRDAKLAGKRFSLDPERDPGVTKASDKAYLCLFFARGKCINGPDCKYLHRLPLPEDESRIPLTHDIFGREKHREHRSDMGGVGSFNDKSNNLYVANLRTSSPDTEEMVRKAFEQFGPVKKVRILKGRGMAFITYRNRTSAEFAKEALADQPIGDSDIVNVRWAHENQTAEEGADSDEEEKILRNNIEAWEAMMADNPQFAQQTLALHQGQYPDTSDQFKAAGTAAAADEPKGQWVQVGDYWVWAGTSDTVNPDAVQAPTETTTPVPQMDEASMKAFQAYQTYYYQNGFPFYYDDSGKVVYYDPSLYDEQTLAYFRSRADASAANPASSKPLYTQ